MRGVTTTGSPPEDVASPAEQRRDLASTREMFRRARARADALAARHCPLEAFRLGQRVEITAPLGYHRPLAGRTGAVMLINESGSAWVRVELPQGRTADYCMMPGECSEEVQS